MLEDALKGNPDTLKLKRQIEEAIERKKASMNDMPAFPEPEELAEPEEPPAAAPKHKNEDPVPHYHVYIVP